MEATRRGVATSKNTIPNLPQTCPKNDFFKIETLKIYNIQNITNKIIEFLEKQT